ncbi:hypothetical protein EJB05_31133 [Eragrostis curvula]|uniref:TSL-kinase interacting protein 1 n=1 Tax=Eragrostis curvula TaxID=38414 RepID=A0A5J9UD55_9POAL|nr:hypothetical protein EJB05_31133 [Eragrostis curvula]
MKAPQQHSNATDTGTKSKSSWNKMQGLKPCAHINKTSGNVAAKCRRGAGFSPSQSHTETEIGCKTGIFMEAPSRDSKKLSARPPNHSGKIKLQLFPIDETIQKILQQEKHNPYLELILAPRKKISSVVQHLNTKWGSAQCAKGELMLFPNDARLDSIAVSEKWTLKDSCTAADVHVAVGSPSTFRLRYGWFGPNLKQQISESSLASAHFAGSTVVNKPSDLVFSEQKQMVASSEFPSSFVKPSIVDNTNTVQAVDNQIKAAPLSWLDGISNISFGALLSEAAPSQDSKPLPSQMNSGLQVPVTCDSFDAAIASLIARQQGSNQPRVSNPSLWEAEETCHAFSFQNQASKRTPSSVPGDSNGTVTASVLGAIPETGTDDDQQCSSKGREEDLNTQTPLSTDDHNAKPEVSMVPHESTGDPELGASCSRLLSGTDSLGLTGLLTNSLDAFQNFSIF